MIDLNDDKAIEEYAIKSRERHIRVTTSPKSKRLTIFLCCLALLGAGGLHDLYLGHYMRGGAKMVTVNWLLIGFVIDLVKICKNQYRDANNKIVCQ